ncbi:hypothetical protein J1G42_04175 [Cellulomonas sp. zg-ZUI222]|uniref:DUF5678 domain-containing protein n=1 Tax=Cellulomonas wangleii TaxID=2816956 RepID=A0ABX8D616_9CELL|nr:MULTISPECIES: hypothetical protein [Cellulomonas]MBO0899169.1 hypothetical protein [Cellulomonas sp. zg-ZUI22]MBO0920019.1 hypothetical protein [Cellulomonas wangleii]MBO0923552.1 hypothetical protein [Cellulomonas wangleii]QVI61886.1 hypothetical protein KG103_15820 [Cellulomonas wangleii]
MSTHPSRTERVRSTRNLLDSVLKPRSGAFIAVRPGTTDVLDDGQRRATELMALAERADLGDYRGVTWDTPIHIKGFRRSS